MAGCRVPDSRQPGGSSAGIAVARPRQGLRQSVRFLRMPRRQLPRRLPKRVFRRLPNFPATPHSVADQPGTAQPARQTGDALADAPAFTAGIGPARVPADAMGDQGDQGDQDDLGYQGNQGDLMSAPRSAAPAQETVRGFRPSGAYAPRWVFERCRCRNTWHARTPQDSQDA